MNEELLKYIIERVINNAQDASVDYAKEKDNFNDGKCLAYYEVLDTIRNELIAHDLDISDYGLDVKIQNVL